LAIVMGVGTRHRHCCLPVVVLLPVVIVKGFETHAGIGKGKPRVRVRVQNS